MVFALLRGHEKTFDLQKKTRIGRDSSNEIILKSQSVSKKHGIIEFEEKDKAELRDLQTRNGTFINKQRSHRFGFLMHLHFFCVLFNKKRCD